MAQVLSRTKTTYNHDSPSFHEPNFNYKCTFQSSLGIITFAFQNWLKVIGSCYDEVLCNGMVVMVMHVVFSDFKKSPQRKPTQRGMYTHTLHVVSVIFPWSMKQCIAVSRLLRTY